MHWFGYDCVKKRLAMDWPNIFDIRSDVMDCEVVPLDIGIDCFLVYIL